MTNYDDNRYAWLIVGAPNRVYMDYPANEVFTSGQWGFDSSGNPTAIPTTSYRYGGQSIFWRGYFEYYRGPRVYANRQFGYTGDVIAGNLWNVWTSYGWLSPDPIFQGAGEIIGNVFNVYRNAWYWVGDYYQWSRFSGSSFPGRAHWHARGWVYCG